MKKTDRPRTVKKKSGHTHRTGYSQTLLNTLSDAVILYDIEGKPVFHNRAAAAFLGNGTESKKHRNIPGIADLRFPDGKPVPHDRMPCSRALRGESAEYECYTITAGGREIMVLASWAPEYTGRAITGAVLVLKEITGKEHETGNGETGLRRSRDRFKTLSEASFEGIAVTESGRFIDVNDQLAGMMGYQKSEMIGKHVADFLPPEDRARVLPDILAGREQIIEHRILRKDGGVITVEAHGKPWVYQGRRARITAIRDITGRKEADEQKEAALEALREQTGRYELVLAGSSAAIWDWDIPNHKIMFSPQWKELRGFDESEVGDREEEWSVGIHPEDTARVSAMIQAHFDGKTPVFAEEYRIRCKDGSWKWIYDRGIALRDAAGNVTRMAGSETDITERKQYELELEAARVDAVNEKSRIEAVMEVLPVGVAILDERGGNVRSNRMFEEIWGGPRPVAQTISEYERYKAWWVDTGKRVRPEEWASAIAIRTGETVVAQTMRIERFDGGTAFINNSAAAIFDAGGRITGCAVVILDITKRTRLEEELVRAQKLESVGILAGGLAHDFNNILTAVIGYLSLAKTQVKPMERVFELLDKADKAAGMAADLTQRIITFARGGEPFMKPAYIGELVREAVVFSLSGSNLECRFSIPDTLDPVRIDEAQIRQVFQNIIINAREAMPEGGSIEVSAENVRLKGDEALSLKKGAHVRISVRDHGTGIPADVLPRIFDPYFSTKERGVRKGMGLGLAVCHSIITKHGGVITAESISGDGTAIHVYFPRSAEKPKAAMTPLRVLVMDDDEMVLSICGDVLRECGYEVSLAHNGGEAVGLFRESRGAGTPYDAVVLDLIVAGGMGGVETLNELHAMDSSVAAVLLSAYLDDPAMADFREKGFMAVLPKPFTIGSLVETVSRVTGKPPPRRPDMKGS